MSFRLSRRTMLRGLGGVAIGLPTLECMLNASGAAYAQSGAALPKRYALLFAGQSIGGDGWERDKHMVAGRRFTEAGHFIAPASAGASWEMTTPLTPLKEIARRLQHRVGHGDPVQQDIRGSVRGARRWSVP